MLLCATEQILHNLIRAFFLWGTHDLLSTALRPTSKESEREIEEKVEATDYIIVTQMSSVLDKGVSLGLYNGCSHKNASE